MRTGHSLVIAVLTGCAVLGCGSKNSDGGDIDLGINGSLGAGGRKPGSTGTGGDTGSSGADGGPASLHPEFDWSADGGDVCYPYPPETNRELLNACEDGCVPFTLALPLLRSDGSLPPLP